MICYNKYECVRLRNIDLKNLDFFAPCAKLPDTSQRHYHRVLLPIKCLNRTPCVYCGCCVSVPYLSVYSKNMLISKKELLRLGAYQSKRISSIFLMCILLYDKLIVGIMVVGTDIIR